MGGHPLLNDRPGDNDPPPSVSLAQVMDQADEQIEAFVFLLAVNPVTTPDIAALLRTSLNGIALPARDRERVLDIWLATALNKLIFERNHRHD